MAALQIISLDTTTPQLRAPASGDTYSAPRALDIAPEGLTGSSATSSLSIAQTWNTSGTPTAIDLNVTDTASNAASLLMNLRVGGTSYAQVSKFGIISLPVVGGDTSGLVAGGSSISNCRLYAGQYGLRLASTSGLSWSSGTNLNSLDLTLARDAAGTLAQRNGVNAQAFNIYNTYTDASNYERGFVRWAGNRLAVGTEGLGTGAQRDLDLQGTSVTVRIGTTNRWYFYTNNHFGPAGNATQDFGTVTLRIRDFYQGGFHEMAEQTAPTAPAADRVRIYAEDNGSGKTRLMALFATGVAQQIAIEP